MLVTGKDETEILIYLDPNAISELINELKGVLHKMVFEQESAA